MRVGGGGMLEKGRVASDSHLSIYIVLFMHAHATLPPLPIMELNLGGGKNAVAYQDSEFVCSDLEGVLSSLMHCP